jgi:PhzF family phenazine biosynthesis protein
MKIFKVDSFTDRAFAGNPAGVCILDTQKDDKWKQNIAREMNLSETAFLAKLADGFNLQWFTPITEVELCGHATLASAHILYERVYLKRNETARFYTKSGILTAGSKEGWIELNFPAIEVEDTSPTLELIDALGIQPKYIGKAKFDYFIETESEDIVRAIKPNFSLLLRAKIRGVIVTSRSSSKKYDFVSRFFAPTVGINEDPVTGSAHCSLGTYWQKKLKKDKLLAYQASERGGIIKVEVAGERVLISGKAVTIMEGELLV